jgi:predicted kinase
MLIVFGGLPGTGKTMLARAFAQRRHATYLRIDTIEQVIRSSEMLAGDVGPAGYMVAYALARQICAWAGSWSRIRSTLSQ